MIQWIKQIFGFKPDKQRKHYSCSGGRPMSHLYKCECQMCKPRIGRLVRVKSSNQLGIVLWWHKGMAPPICLKVRYFPRKGYRAGGAYSVFEKDVEYLDETR